MNRVQSWEERQTLALERIAAALEKMEPSLCDHGWPGVFCHYCKIARENV